MPVDVIPLLSKENIKSIGFLYQPGFFWHVSKHSRIASEIYNYSEVNGARTFKERWTYLINQYRKLRNHSTQLARDILTLFNDRFEVTLTGSGKSVQELADLMQQQVDALNELVNLAVFFPVEEAPLLPALPNSAGTGLGSFSQGRNSSQTRF